jgi:hypothetical protein
MRSRFTVPPRQPTAVAPRPGGAPDSTPCDAKPDAPSDPARETAVSHARVQAVAVCHQELAVSGQAAGAGRVSPGGAPPDAACRTARWSWTPFKT